MTQVVKQENTEGFDVQRYVGIIRRRHLAFLIPMFLGWFAVWGSSWILPPRYKSSTLIMMEQPTMPRDYVVPNVNEDVQERLQNITQQILSRTRLMHVVDELNLYTGDRRRHNPDEIVERMRKDIEIEFVQDAQRRVIAFRINYSAPDPLVAQQVTSKLTNLVINENLEVRQQQSEDTTKFLEDQLETARQNLAEQEEKIREFKGQHVNELPTQVGSNLQILNGLQSQLQTEQGALNAAKQQQVYLEALIREYRTLGRSPNSPDGAQMGLPAVNQELDKLKAQLADLTSRYKDQFPEVRKLKHRIAAMEKLRDQLMADVKSKGNGHPSDTGQGASAEALAEFRDNPQILQLQGQLQGNRIEIKNHEQMVASLKTKIDDYQARLNQEPVREQQLADLTRGYDQSKATYDELLRKKNQSAMATSMELLQQGERFRIIDPPSLPTKPSFPNRLKFCGLGLIVGLALGMLIGGVLEVMDDRVYREQELRDLLPVAVISEIPVLSAPENEKAEHKRVWFGWATAAVVLAIIAVGSAISYLKG